MGVTRLSVSNLILIYTLLAVPMAIAGAHKLQLVKPILVAIVRMTVQLALVGLYLGVIFDRNDPILNALWLLAMILVANSAILRSAGLSRRVFFFMTMIGVGLATFSVLGVLVLGAIAPDPLYDARYLIPLGGMLLGNCMRGNIIALERFYDEIAKNEREYLTYIFMGATTSEAVRGFFHEALRAALLPTVSTMATMGLVSLPGMMTGQILGGSDPTTAISYQLAIMVSIFTSVSLGAWLNLRLSIRIAFTDRGTLRDDLWRRASPRKRSTQ